jgi:NAD(P)-dependent dehydrogenase (short-subunit alcohol dehydrogenase family)
LNQLVLVTGGSGGIGRAICSALSRAGYDLAVLDPHPALAPTGHKGAFGHFAVDAADREGVETAVTEILSGVADLWGLVNCVGMMAEVPFLETSDEIFDRTMRVNLKSLFVCSQIVARRLVTKGEGRIVNILSTSSNLGFARLSAYDASKGACQQLTRTMAIELGPFGVQVNGVAPGSVETQMTTNWMGTERVATHELERTPMGRIGRPEDIAEAVAFLMSPRATWINGATLVVDGGYSVNGLPFFPELRSGGGS